MLRRQEPKRNNGEAPANVNKRQTEREGERRRETMIKLYHANIGILP